MSGPGPATRLVALLGHPVAHSVSPQIHNAAFAAAGVDAVYVAFDVPPDALGQAVRGLRALGALGANVTVPHKVAALGVAEHRTAEAELVGAANTLVFGAHGVTADNTDAAGLAVVLERDLRVRGGDTVLVFGAGGAARAAAVALGRAGTRVRVLARRPEAAAEIEALAAAHGAAPGYEDPPRVVVNATPLGLHGEALPPAVPRPATGQVALDLLYGPKGTPFLAEARAAGALAVDGLGMLVAQAAAAFTRWTGVEAPLEVMAAAARAAVAGPRRA